MEEHGMPALTAKWVERYGLQVRAGPFAGMKFLAESAGSMLIPKLLGSYESELHSIIGELLERGSFAKVVDVGCAEGYYAVGFALRLPTTAVYAFDSDAHARRLCRRLSALNGVEKRVQVFGKCEATDLHRLDLTDALLICDCEGFEYRLLDPPAVPSLGRAWILVELHGPSEATTTLHQRFAKTHRIETVSSETRDPSSFDELSFLCARERDLAISEWRTNRQQWSLLRPFDTTDGT
jgi:hypothetical protein